MEVQKLVKEMVPEQLVVALELADLCRGMDVGRGAVDAMKTMLTSVLKCVLTLWRML